MYNLNKIRKEFPILNTEVYGKPLIYLDNAATTQKPLVVLNAIEEAYRHYNANIHRGVHHISQVATDRHEHARSRVARYINAPSAEEILFVRGTTEAINLVAASYGSLVFDDEAEVIITGAEHHSNIVPWQIAGAQLRVAPVNEQGDVDLESYAHLFNEHTRMVAITHVSNVLGTINPVKEMIAIAHKHGVRVLIDGAQAIAHLRIDVQDLDADFYAFSGHKVYAPTGIGVLYGKRELLEAMPPYQGGGEMIAKVTYERTTFNELPYKFEAGTPDYVSSTALAAALDYLEGLDIDCIAAHENTLLQQLTEGLSLVNDIHFFGSSTHKGGLLSFLVGDVHPYDMGMLLDKLGFAVRTGHHCAQPLMDSLGIPGTVRVSLGLYNTEEEVDKFLTGIRRVLPMLLGEIGCDRCCMRGL